MKKLILLVMAMVLALTACGKKGKPDEVPQEVYDALVPLVSALDEYVKGEIDLDDLKRANDAADAVIMPFYESNTELSTSEKLKAASLLHEMTQLSLLFSKSYLSIATEEDAPEKKEFKSICKSLKKELGM